MSWAASCADGLTASCSLTAGDSVGQNMVASGGAMALYMLVSAAPLRSTLPRGLLIVLARLESAALCEQTRRL